MKPGQEREFAELITGVAEMYGKPISKAGMAIWWNCLQDYEFDDVRHAFTAHARDTRRGSWMPKPADIIRQIAGETPNVDQIIGMALKPSTPLGVLCRIEIGSWNLENYTTERLRPLAERCIAKLPEWSEKINAGQFADNERLALERYGLQADNQRRLQ